MKQTEIHLSGPFEEVLASLLTLPSTHTETDDVSFSGAADSVLGESAKCDAEVKEALRSVYEAAHGRQVETQIGFVAIAPPVADFLKEAPYYVTTQYEFFLEAFTRLLAGASPRKERANVSWTPRGKLVTSRRGTDVPRRHTRREKRKCFPLPNVVTIYEQPTTNAPMTNLPIHITTHHLSMSNALRRFAREKISSVCRFANDALAADVVLRRHGGTKERFSASARLALPGRDIHGRAVAGNLYAAIGKLVAKLARLSRKRKTRLAKTFEHPGRGPKRTMAAAPAPRAYQHFPVCCESCVCFSRAGTSKSHSMVHLSSPA